VCTAQHGVSHLSAMGTGGGCVSAYSSRNVQPLDEDLVKATVCGHLSMVVRNMRYLQRRDEAAEQKRGVL